MNPQNHRQTANNLADWVNDAPTIEVSAVRYNQIIHGVLPKENPLVPAPRFKR